MVLPLGDSEKTRIIPIVTYLLIAVNVALYIYERDRGPTFETAYAATPYEITHEVDIDRPFVLHFEPDEGEALGQARRPEIRIEQGPGPSPIWLTLLTSLFLHASPLHLAGNMLSLWIFGDNVEEVLGTVRYLVVYLICGIAGTLAQVAFAPNSLIPTLGASGAIAGLMGAYIVWFPRNRVRVLFLNFLTEMPAFLVIGVWIAIQIVRGYGSFGRIGEVGGVAYLAHLGGATVGVLVAAYYRNRAIAVQAEAYRDAWKLDD